MAGGEVYEFGPCVFDATERRLSRHAQNVALTPKAHALLLALLRRSGRLVTKQELLDEVWPDTHVEEGVLAVHMSALRKALGEREAGHFIETVPRAGYRFTAPVVRRTPAAFSLRWPIGVLPRTLEVFEIVARGRAHLMTSSRAEIPRAIAAFDTAIERDATYAPAHAALALAHCAQAELRLLPQAQAHELARAAALRALAMDSSCADAQTALGAVLFLSDWNWKGAERSLERALALDAGSTDAHLLYGRLLDALGHLDQGLAVKHKALEREPSSARVHIQIAHSLWNQRRYDDVIDWATRALALDPKHLLAREYIAGAYLMKGDHDRHMAEGLAHAETFGTPRETLAHLRALYAAQGRQAVVRWTLDEAARNGAPPLQLAVLFAETGQRDQALEHLDRAIDARDPCLVDLAVAPQWDPLRSHPGFARRLDRMGLPLFRPSHAL
jgi:DNA-binding winged helix-turn-helix (wHTH) protein